MTRTILYISGTRADYGLMRSVLSAIDGNPGLRLEIGVTGMHLLPEFGSTIEEIRRDGYSCHVVNATCENDSKAAMARFVGECITGCVDLIRRVQPDIIMVLGDRGEMLGAAIAGVYLGIPVVHIHGGDLTSTVDDIARHAITKLSHVHCPATRDSADRIIRMGEDPRHVHVVGSPGLEQILNECPEWREDLFRTYGLDESRRLILVLFHPESFSGGDPQGQMDALLRAVLSFHEQVIVIYPNSDSGGRAMIDVIRNYEKNQGLRAFPSVPHQDYLGLLKSAAVLVGNSSSGIIEAPSFHTPVVNVGNRQQGRIRGKNVIDTGYSEGEIRCAIDTALHDSRFRDMVRTEENPYGDGKTSQRIVTILRDLRITPELLQKRMMY